MDIVNNYKSYKQYLPDYANWRDEQDLNRAKRLDYLKKHPEKMNAEDIQRGKILLRSIDVMDEYSQSNAEDMETATDFATGQIVGFATMGGTIGGTLLTMAKPVQKIIAKVTKGNQKLEMLASVVPSLIGMLVGMAASFPAVVWATKAQVSASRKGRFEAMSKDLKNPATFAVLTPEQQKKAEEIAKDIKLDDKDKKRLNKKQGLNFNPLESISTLKKYYKNDSEYQTRKAEFDKSLAHDESKFATTTLTEKQIRDAKRDQQILSDMVRRIDVASQDYAENTELATNTITTLALGTGGLAGWLSHKIMKGLKIKGNGMVSKAIPWVVGATLPLVAGIYSAKIQKQASRIGRYKIKQEMLNNPAELVYVDDKDIASSDVKTFEKHKKPNLFKFMANLYKDNKEYQDYVKTEGEKELKMNKAIEKLELSDEQIQDAKALQKNIFKTFNKVDEKSQAYSESVEAMGEITKNGVQTFGSLAATGISLLMALRMMENSVNATKSLPKIMAKLMTPFALVLLPVIGIDIFTTKAQKKASSVADMMALKELDDYKHYVDYSNVK